MIQVSDLRHYGSLPPAEKLLVLVFAMVAKDRATTWRLDYRPDLPDARMWYSVAGVPYEMVPPPAHVWPDLFRVLWRHTRREPPARWDWLARWRPPRSFPAMPVGGVLPVRYHGVVVPFDILFYRGRTGEHVLVEKPTPPDLGPAGDWFFTNWARTRGNDMVVEFSDEGPEPPPR